MMPEHILYAQQLAFDMLTEQLQPARPVDFTTAGYVLCIVCPGDKAENDARNFFLDGIEYLGGGRLALDLCELTEPLEFGNKPKRKEGTQQRLVIHRDKITPLYVPVLFLGIIAGLLMRMRAGMPLNAALEDVMLDRTRKRKKTC